MNQAIVSEVHQFDTASARTAPKRDAGVTLRLIRSEETGEVGALARRAYEQDYPGQPAEYLAEIEDVAARAEAAQVWVAVDDATGALCGTVTLPEPGRVLSDVAAVGECDVRLLAVSHAARGRGIGALLMRHAIETARSRGASRLVLNTTNEMAGACRLYERMGFERLRERELELTRPSGARFTLRAYGLSLQEYP
ncbi:GNAT family N-acetyltransferase [Leucobacter sp. HY1908]